MAGVTLAQAQAQLDAWLAASLKVATQGQAYEIEGGGGGGGSRSLTRVNAEHIDRMIKYWREQVAVLSSPSGASGVRRRVRYVVPH